MSTYKVSFDFDGTLAINTIKLYAKDLIDRGIEVWIVTSRFDNQEHIKRFHVSPEFYHKVNYDLNEIAEELGIPKSRIIYTNMISKWKFIKDKEFLWHLDDDWIETDDINKNAKPTKGISCWGTPKWREKCEKIIKKREL